MDVSGRYHIIFNGEIYNYREIKKELIAKGYTFNTATDTEVLLVAYMEWGTAFFARLNGFFALAIYDQQRGETIIARDRVGIKPLIYRQDEKGIAFGSEIKAILPFGEVRVVNKEALNLYFQLTYIPAPLTIFKGIHKLEPGQYLKVTGHQVEKHRYYQLPYREKPTILSMDEATRGLRSLMEQSVARRLIADVPVGTFLSGGIDSSVITTLAARQHHQIDSFSIGYRDHPFFDETQFAEAVAKKAGTNHHVFSLTNDDLLAHVEAMVTYLDEPFADSSAIPVFILSRMTRQHVKVALSGDGADELFSGYNKHEAWMMAQKKDWVNWVIKWLGGVVNHLPQSRQSAMGNITRKVVKYKRLLELSPQEQYWMLASFGSELQRSRLLNGDYFQSLSGFKNDFLTDFQSADFNSFLKKDVELVLTGDMLRKVDAMSMANALEVRVPFLDHEIIDFAFDLQAQLKLSGAQRKRVIKEAFRGDLPDELYQRGKQGFEVPLLDWFQKELASELDRWVFDKELIQSQGIFQLGEMAVLKQKLNSNNPGDAPITVWQIYVFQKWWYGYLMS